MKEIIFWFSKYDSKNYWFNYAAGYCSNKFQKAMKFDTGALRYSRVEDWIQIGDLKILFKVDLGSRSYIGWGDTNQYWVEALFDNNFEEFFMSIVKEEIKNGEKAKGK